ncbi:hypothetical protein ACA910_004804 [Epithemia clementina (nom. ined.)]
MLRSVETTTWSTNNDFGEMFLNFWLHPELRKYTGIDLTGIFKEELLHPLSEEKHCKKQRMLWETWNRCAMGLLPSPYQATQSAQRVKRLALGDRDDPLNVFRWSKVVLNLPGNEGYDPTRPWVYRVRKDGVIAADVHPYVDDMRETGPTEEDAWKAASKIAKTAAYFGLQDAARKRRPPSTTPGAWAGAVIESTSEGVYKLVSQERWEKVRSHISMLRDWADSKAPINRKALERIRGYLVYVSLTYGMMVPYLKGLHLTLKSWRED